MLAIVVLRSASGSRARRRAPYYSGLVRQRRAFAEEPVVPDLRAAAGGACSNTAIFSFLTGISRVVGLLREVVFASYFGTTGFASAFAIAYQVPNIAQLFAQSALSAAFVPVFTDLLQKGRRKEAVRLASTLFWIMLIGARRDHRCVHPCRWARHAAVHRLDVQPRPERR